MEELKLNLVHYSEKPLDKIFSVRQPVASPKPIGLWVSVEGGDDGWRQWCEAEKFELSRLAVKTEIVLAVGAKILHLESEGDIDAATLKYAITNTAPEEIKFYSFFMDWDAIAKSFDGVIIAPYCWERRLCPSARWYYGWDCASGCIWNAGAIDRLLAHE